MKSIRFYITEQCNAKCNNCFNRKERNNAQMDLDHFVELCDYFSSNGYTLLKVMGGEPTLHPQFEEIITIAQQKFPRVNLFTNAITNALQAFNPRIEDGIIYNFKFHRAITKDKLLLDKEGMRCLEIQVTSHTDCESLINAIKSVAELSNGRVHPVLTLDCTSNIFEEKNIVIPIYEYIWDFCKRLGLEVGQDHLIPMCYIIGSKIPMPHKGIMCNTDCAGLIDANYNVRFCNQYSDILTNIYQKGKYILPIEDYKKIIVSKFAEIQSTSSNKGCKTCPMHNTYCNGGCFAAKDNIIARWNY